MLGNQAVFRASWQAIFLPSTLECHAMQAQDYRFTDIIKGNKQFTIPVFQRDYSWTTKQCEQMWNDVLRVSEGGHFIGSIIYMDAGTSSASFQNWLVIDGQQRLTSLTLLLTALRDHLLVETGWKGTENSPTANQINDEFLKNPNEEGDRIYKLVLRHEDDATLRALVDGKEPLGHEEGASKLINDAFQY